MNNVLAIVHEKKSNIITIKKFELMLPKFKKKIKSSQLLNIY